MPPRRAGAGGRRASEAAAEPGGLPRDDPLALAGDAVVAPQPPRDGLLAVGGDEALLDQAVDPRRTAFRP